MTTIDIIILILIGISGITGFSRGFFKELATIAGLIIGLIVARALYLSLAEEVAPILHTSITVAQIISFIGIWLIVPLGFTLIAGALTRAFRAISLGWLNHLAGVAMGMLKCIIIIGLVVIVLDNLDKDNKLISKTNKENSLLYYPVRDFVEGIFFPSNEKVIEKKKEYIIQAYYGQNNIYI